MFTQLQDLANFFHCRVIQIGIVADRVLEPTDKRTLFGKWGDTFIPKYRSSYLGKAIVYRFWIRHDRLVGQQIEQDQRSQTVTTKRHLSLEIWVALDENLIETIQFVRNSRDDGLDG